AFGGNVWNAELRSVTHLGRIVPPLPRCGKPDESVDEEGWLERPVVIETVIPRLLCAASQTGADRSWEACCVALKLTLPGHKKRQPVVRSERMIELQAPDVAVDPGLIDELVVLSEA